MATAFEFHRTGIDELDRLIGGFPRGSRTIVSGPPGSGKTVFAMHFAWAGLQAGERVAWDVFDRPWPRLRRYFASFGWDVAPSEASGALIPIQAFPHDDAFPRDPAVRYFDLADIEAMRRIDLDLTAAGVSRFVFADSYEGIFHLLTEAEWHRIEEWTVNWCHHGAITNFDVVNEIPDRDEVTRRLLGFTDLLANNLVRFRIAETGGRRRRELRIERLEGHAHPLDWLPFEITAGGFHLLDR